MEDKYIWVLADEYDSIEAAFAQLDQPTLDSIASRIYESICEENQNENPALIDELKEKIRAIELNGSASLGYHKVMYVKLNYLLDKPDKKLRDDSDFKVKPGRKICYATYAEPACGFCCGGYYMATAGFFTDCVHIPPKYLGFTSKEMPDIEWSVIELE